jgi:hypothetical protein
MSKIDIIRIGVKLGDVQEMKIEDRLENYQHLVGGYIETVAMPDLYEHGIIMIVNEEGLLRQFDVNENLCPFFYVGQAILVTFKGEDIAGLDEHQKKIARAFLENCRRRSAE